MELLGWITFFYLITGMLLYLLLYGREQQHIIRHLILFVLAWCVLIEGDNDKEPTTDNG